ncbi:calcium-binding protein [Microvirga alba]|uniref:Calcium-binding protein n=1 Tax=Microvirga alba TaxID=2791025 RepID=A0A931BR52_9HYPH|nr:calcium-binding protein [Microvirga alba]MBF9234144.1 calcium-binding protein [Microvirga alba]
MSAFTKVSLGATPRYYEIKLTDGDFDLNRSFRFAAVTADAVMPDDYVLGTEALRFDLNNFRFERVTTGSPRKDKHEWQPRISPDGQTVIFKTDKGLVSKNFATGALTTAHETHAPDHTGGSVKSADGSILSLGGAYSAAMIETSGGEYSIVITAKATGKFVTVPTMAAGAFETDSKPLVTAISNDGRFVLYQDFESTFYGDRPADHVVDIVRYTTMQAAKEDRDLVMDIGTMGASKVFVDWGDGSRVTETAGRGATTLMHGYGADGTYHVTLKALCSSTTTQQRTAIVASTANTGEVQQNLSGTAGHDIVLGSPGSDAVALGGGDDIARTGAGDDILRGGLGNDTLIGGSGRDIFIFDTKPNKKTNLDKIVDFNVKEDTIWLDNAIFKKLGTGTEIKPVMLNKAFFIIGNHAKDKNDYIYYDNKTGILSYDADGSGAGAAVELAILTRNLKMTAANFFII